MAQTIKRPLLQKFSLSTGTASPSQPHVICVGWSMSNCEYLKIPKAAHLQHSQTTAVQSFTADNKYLTSMPPLGKLFTKLPVCIVAHGGFGATTEGQTLKHIRRISVATPSRADQIQDALCLVIGLVVSLLEFLGGSAPGLNFLNEKCIIPEPNDDGS